MIRAKVENAGAIKAVGSKILVKRAMFAGDIASMTKMLQLAVAQGLEALLGDVALHFAVNYGGNATTYWVSVTTVDDIGKYIYYGTAAHDEEGWPLGETPGREYGVSGPLDHPIYGSVHIPAIPGRKPEIDREVHMALERAMVFFR